MSKIKLTGTAVSSSLNSTGSFGRLDIGSAIDIDVNSGQGQIGMSSDAQRLFLWGGSNRAAGNGAYIQLDGTNLGGSLNLFAGGATGSVQVLGNLSGSLGQTGSFSALKVVAAEDGTTITTDRFGLTIDGQVGYYPLTVSSPYETAARFISTDGTCAIEIGDNSSTTDYNKIQVVGNSKMEFFVNNQEVVKLAAGGSATVFNEDSLDINFRFEGADDENLLYLDAGKNHATIGAARGNTGDEKLLVAGDVGITGSLHVSGNITTSGSIIAKEFRTEFINQIIATSSGSTEFGDDTGDVHRFTGSLNISASTGASQLVVGTGNVARYISVSDERALFGYDGTAAVVQGGAGSKGLKLGVNNATLGTNAKLFISSSGNEVGIHTDSPRNGFDVTSNTHFGNDLGHTHKFTGSVNITGSLTIPTGSISVRGGVGGTNIANFSRNVGASADIDIHAGGGDPQITFTANRDFSIGHDISENSFKISEHTSVGTNDRLIITDAGKVGIGALNANIAAQLEVQAPTGSAPMQIRPSDPSTALNPLIQFRSQLNGTVNYLMAGNGGHLYFATYDSGTPTDVSKMIRFSPDATLSPKMYMGDDGSAESTFRVGGPTNGVFVKGGASGSLVSGSITSTGSFGRVDLGVGGDLRLPDNSQLKVGGGTDLQIYHDGTNSYLANYTGDLDIYNNTNDGDISFFTDDGSGGTTEYLALRGDEGQMRASKQLRMQDNVQLQVGSDGDAQLFHNTADTYLANSTGNLILEQNTNDGDIILKSDDGSGGVTPYITLDGSASRVVIGDVDLSIPVAKRLYFGGSDHTYISEDIDDRLRFFVGGAEMFRLNEINDFASFFTDVALAATDKLYFDGGSDTYIAESSADIMDFTVGGDLMLRLDEASNKVNVPQSEFMVSASYGWFKNSMGGSTDNVEVIRLGAMIDSPNNPLAKFFVDDAQDRLEYNILRYHGKHTFTRGSAAGGHVKMAEIFGDSHTKFEMYHQSNNVSGGSTTGSRVIQLYASTGSSAQSYIRSGGGLAIETGSVVIGGTSATNSKLNVKSEGSTQSVIRIDGDDARGASRFALQIVDDDTNSRGSVSISTTSGYSIDANSDINISGSKGIRIGGEARLFGDLDYTTLRKPDGGIGLYLGGSDAANYYDNTKHRFRPSGGGSNYYMTISTGGLGISRGSDDAEAKLHIGDGDNDNNALSSNTLGTASGSVINMFKLEADSTNASQLLYRFEREATGSDWTTAGLKILARTDVTEQAWIKFNGQGNTYGLAFGAGTNNNNLAMRIDQNRDVTIQAGGLSIPATEKLIFDSGSGQTYITETSNDILNLYTGGENILELSSAGGDPRISYFNKDNRDRDFSFCGDTNDNALYFDASAERVGIGTSTPTQTLDVAGHAHIEGNIYFGDDSKWQIDDTSWTGGSANQANIMLTGESGTFGFHSNTGVVNVLADGQIRAIADLLSDAGIVQSAAGVDLKLRRGTNDDDIIKIEASETKIYGDTVERVRFGSYGIRNGYDGTNSAPAYSFKDDTDTGMRRNGSGVIDFINDGIRRLRIEADGDLVLSSDGSVQGASIHRIGGLYFTWDRDSYGTNQQHAILCSSDDLIINSFDNVTINLDSNDNDSAEAFQVRRHGIDLTSGELLYSIDQDGNSYTMAASQVGNGSVSAPSLSFYNDTNTGIYTSGADSLNVTTGGGERAQFNSLGLKVVNGALGVDATPNGTDGRIDASNDVVAFSSDKRLKQNIRFIENPLEKVSQLSGFIYNWNEKANKEAGYDMDKDYVGVFAQDVEKIQPEAVKIAPFDNDGTDNSKSGENYLTVQYEKLVPLLIESIKELKKEIEELKK